MIKLKRYFRPKSTLVGIAFLSLPLFGVSAASAQESDLVVTPSYVEAVKSKIDYQGTELNAAGTEILLVEDAELDIDLVAPSESYSDDGNPTLEIKTRDDYTFSLGVLSAGTDTADGVTRRDPYAIENIEVDPIYPEGIYVDEMRAAAGVGVTSKF